MPPNLIQEFRRLPSQERAQALAALTTELTPYEWRALGAVISSRSFHLDIVGRLPVELVARIFSHLDPSAPYRWQTVSKQWSHVLRSLDVLKAGLNSWHQGIVHLQHADYAICKTKSRNIHAFRTGNPKNIYSFKMEHRLKTCILAGDYLIWQTLYDSRNAYLLNLHTWYSRNLGGQGREHIRSVVASDQMVVLTTHTNICYVYELHERRGPKRFSLPNQRYLDNMACRGRTVACVAASDRYTCVFIWDFDTQRGTSFEIDNLTDALFSRATPRAEHHQLLPLVQPANKTVILFVVDSSRSQHSPDMHRLAFSRYTYSGECIGTFRPSLPELHTWLLWDMRPLVPVDDSGTVFATRVALRHYGHDPEATCSLPLRFDEKTHEVRLWHHPVAPRQGPRAYEAPRYSLAWWKDTCYGFREGSASERGDALAFMGTRGAEAYKTIIPAPANMYMGDSEVNEPVLLNEKYVIKVSIEAVHLLCFHESSNRPKENGAFFDFGELAVLQ